MRAVIFMGLMSIASSIENEPIPEKVASFIAWVFAVAVIMDVTEWYYNLKKKK